MVDTIISSDSVSASVTISAAAFFRIRDMLPNRDRSILALLQAAFIAVCLKGSRSIVGDLSL
jgi:hypothetical protein